MLLMNCKELSLFFDNRREDKGQDEKGVWWMPWHQGAKKDVAGCEKPRGAASEHRSVGIRMGQPGRRKVRSSCTEQIGV
jgi:hypothetical protein